MPGRIFDESTQTRVRSLHSHEISLDGPASDIEEAAGPAPGSVKSQPRQQPPFPGKPTKPCDPQGTHAH